MVLWYWLNLWIYVFYYIPKIDYMASRKTSRWTKVENKWPLWYYIQIIGFVYSCGLGLPSWGLGVWPAWLQKKLQSKQVL